MRQRNIVFIVLSVILLLSACSGKDKYEPFTELSKQTVSPEREAAIQAALEGDRPAPTEEPVIDFPEPEPIIAPTFDESSFFAEVDPEPVFETEEVPFEPEPTATLTPLPTNTPLPTATKPYDPNITMYGKENGLTTYMLQDGDDLVCLGRRFNLSVSYLMKLNNLTDPYEVGPGYTVMLPRNPDGWSMVDGYGRQRLIMHPATYTIKDGDTLFSIACSYGDVYPEDIAVQNQLVIGEPLPVGLTIVIP